MSSPFELPLPPLVLFLLNVGTGVFSIQHTPDSFLPKEASPSPCPPVFFSPLLHQFQVLLPLSIMITFPPPFLNEILTLFLPSVPPLSLIVQVSFFVV